MLELFNSPEGILTVISSGTGIGGIITAIIYNMISNIKAKSLNKANAVIVQKDTQIEEISKQNEKLSKAIGMLASIVVEDALSRPGFKDSAVVQDIAKTASCIKNLCDIDLTGAVSSTVDKIIEATNSSVLAAKKEALVSKTQTIEKVVDNNINVMDEIISKMITGDSDGDEQQ